MWVYRSRKKSQRYFSSRVHAEKTFYCSSREFNLPCGIALFREKLKNQFVSRLELLVHLIMSHCWALRNSREKRTHKKKTTSEKLNLSYVHFAKRREEWRENQRKAMKLAIRMKNRFEGNNMKFIIVEFRQRVCKRLRLLGGRTQQLLTWVSLGARSEETWNWRVGRRKKTKTWRRRKRENCDFVVRKDRSSSPDVCACSAMCSDTNSHFSGMSHDSRCTLKTRSILRWGSSTRFVPLWTIFITFSHFILALFAAAVQGLLNSVAACHGLWAYITAGSEVSSVRCTPRPSSYLIE